MDKFYENSIKKLKSFYEINPNDADVNLRIFRTLKAIIPFKYGEIIYLNSEENSPAFTSGENGSYLGHARQMLNINNLPYGYIEIFRDEKFSRSELEVFETCAAIISNMIKEKELNSIIKTQLLTLQDGISAKTKAYQKIAEAENLKNQFISNVSHELRSPLNSILGFTELLSAQFTGSLNEKQLEYVEDIRIAGLHLLNMVNEILDMSKIESKSMTLNLTKFSIKLNIQEVLNILTPLFIKKRQKISLKIKKDFEVTADYQKIQQILFNLLSNAIKFTPEEGAIEITADKQGKFSRISVKDTGCGIPKKYYKKIFNKFEQLKETPNSTGLGLTITAELVKLHGGSISVKSELGKGAEFILKLPEI